MERPNSRESLAAATIRSSRRLTSTLYATAATGIQLISVDPQYDPELYHDDVPVPTRRSKANSYPPSGYYQPGWQTPYVPSSPILQSVNLRREQQQVPLDPFEDAYRIEAPTSETQNPFDDSNVIAPVTQVGERPTTAAPNPEEPYHALSKSRKRLLIGIIGVAGLCSGLSSNIYFPSLDAIAKVS